MSQSNHPDGKPAARSDLEAILRRARYERRETLVRRALSERGDDPDYASLFDHVRVPG